MKLKTSWDGQDRRQPRVEMHSTDPVERLLYHEELCEQRQSAILERLNRIESILLTTAGSVILALAAVAWYFFQHTVLHSP